MKCASEKWKEVFVVNELSFEPLKDSCTSDKDTPIFIAKDVLKYPEQVREFMENGYWWDKSLVIEDVLDLESLLILVSKILKIFYSIN